MATGDGDISFEDMLDYECSEDEDEDESSKYLSDIYIPWQYADETDSDEPEIQKLNKQFTIHKVGTKPIRRKRWKTRFEVCKSLWQSRLRAYDRVFYDKRRGRKKGLVSRKGLRQGLDTLAEELLDVAITFDNNFCHQRQPNRVDDNSQSYRPSCSKTYNVRVNT